MISRACGNAVLASFHLIFLDLQFYHIYPRLYIKGLMKAIETGFTYLSFDHFIN